MRSIECTSSYFFFRSHISKTTEPIFTKSSRQMANGCNRKVLFLKSFGSGRAVQKCHFLAVPAGRSFTKSRMSAKWIYLSKKRNLSDLGRIISLSSTARPRSVGAFIPIFDSGALLSREKLSSFLSLCGATL